MGGRGEGEGGKGKGREGRGRDVAPPMKISAYALDELSCTSTAWSLSINSVYTNIHCRTETCTRIWHPRLFQSRKSPPHTFQNLIVKNNIAAIRIAMCVKLSLLQQ